MDLDLDLELNFTWFMKSMYQVPKEIAITSNKIFKFLNKRLEFN